MPPPSTLEMLVPANAVGKVLGKGGANIANIRKVGSHILNLFFFYSVAEGTNSWSRHISINLKLMPDLVLALAVSH